jgi:hypothetical protein
MKPERRGWSPYLAGALSGVVLVLSVLVAGRYFGASASFVRSVGLLGNAFGPERVEQMDYFRAIVPGVDWQWMFVLGILLGALVSSVTSGSFRLKSVPDMWRSRFGGSVFRRAAVAFLGGLVSLYGARMAGG